MFDIEEANELTPSKFKKVTKNKQVKASLQAVFHSSLCFSSLLLSFSLSLSLSFLLS